MGLVQDDRCAALNTLIGCPLSVQGRPFLEPDVGDAVEAFLHGVAERELFGRERGGVEHFLHYQGVVEAAFTTAAILTTVLKKFFEFTLPAVRMYVKTKALNIEPKLLPLK